MRHPRGRGAPEASGVQYGGAAVDWQEADAADADGRFWHDYEAYRTSTIELPASFWQHEHITRRPIRLRKKWAEKRSAVSATERLLRFDQQGRQLALHLRGHDSARYAGC